MTQRTRIATDALCLALLALIAIGMGQLLLKAALNSTATVAQAEALKGM